MRIIFLALFVLGFSVINAQELVDYQYQNVKALEKALASAKTKTEKTNALICLYLYHSLHNDSANNQAAKNYLKQLEIFTQETGDPELIASAMYWEGRLLRNIDEVTTAVNRLNDFAKLHNLVFYQACAKNLESFYASTLRGDNAKATELLNESVNLAKRLDDDSLKAVMYFRNGYGCITTNNYLMALQLAFQGDELAIKLKMPVLKEQAMALFARIYSRMKNYTKAADYYLKEIEMLKSLNLPFIESVRHAFVARVLFSSQQPILAQYHVEQAYRIADSIKGSKRLYNDITGIAVTVLSQTSYTDLLRNFLKNYRQHFFIFPGSDLTDFTTLAMAHRMIGNQDSANYLIRKAANYISENHSTNTRRNYFLGAGIIALDNHDLDAAEKNYNQALQIALSQNDLTYSITIVDSLKNLSLLQKDLSKGIHFYRLEDSLQLEQNKQLDKEEISREEVTAFEKQKQLEEIEKEKEKQQRFNLQYLAITFNVVALFLILMILGLFRASAKTIRVISFFSFLLFFEFIFLVFKKKIYIITQGEPWMDLGLMVLLAAIMVPLHHWAEHRVIHYLSTKKLVIPKLKLLQKKSDKPEKADLKQA